MLYIDSRLRNEQLRFIPINRLLIAYIDPWCDQIRLSFIHISQMRNQILADSPRWEFGTAIVYVGHALGLCTWHGGMV